MPRPEKETNAAACLLFGTEVEAAIATGRTAVGNEWLAERLAMGHGSHVSILMQRIRRSQKDQRILRKYAQI